MDGENGTYNEELTNPTTPMNVASLSQEQQMREEKKKKKKESRPRLSYTWFSQRWQQSHVLNVVGSENTRPSTGEHSSECATNASLTSSVPQKHTSIESFLLTASPPTHFLLETACPWFTVAVRKRKLCTHSVHKVRTLGQYQHTTLLRFKRGRFLCRSRYFFSPKSRCLFSSWC